MTDTQTSQDPVVHTAIEDRVLEIVLARPPANALGAPIVEGLADATRRIDGDDVRAVVVRSDVPGFFAAGADIKQMGTLDGPTFAEYRDALRASIEGIAASGVPSIAAIVARSPSCSARRRASQSRPRPSLSASASSAARCAASSLAYSS